VLQLKLVSLPRGAPRAPVRAVQDGRRIRTVLTFGVDLASQDRRTAGCLVRWHDRPVVVEVMRPLSDDAIVRGARDPEVGATAIDAPFGWPRAFVDAVAQYGLGHPFPEPDGNLWLRVTDRVVKAAVRRPLSVSSDRIAYPAVRAARLLSLLGPTRPACRDGSDGVIEVYPAAALAAWEIKPGRYKGPDGPDARRSLLSALAQALPGLDVGDQGPALVETDHAIDALIAALVARAHMLGQVRRPTEAQAKDAAVEGWIWLPDRPARFLLGASQQGCQLSGW
jgi:predicted nuclease with RNAse H fold